MMYFHLYQDDLRFETSFRSSGYFEQEPDHSSGYLNYTFPMTNAKTSDPGLFLANNQTYYLIELAAFPYSRIEWGMFVYENGCIESFDFIWNDALSIHFPAVEALHPLNITDTDWTNGIKNVVPECVVLNKDEISILRIPEQGYETASGESIRIDHIGPSDNSYVYVYFDTPLSSKDGYPNAIRLKLSGWENEQNSGLIQTQEQPVEDGNRVGLQDWQASELEIDVSNAIVGNAVCSSLDIAMLEGEMLDLQGWAFVEGKEADDQKVYVQIQEDASDKCFTTLLVSRPDVAEEYQNENYEMSGFSSRIHLNEMQSNQLTVTILVEIDGQVFQGKSYDLRIDGDQVMN